MFSPDHNQIIIIIIVVIKVIIIIFSNSLFFRAHRTLNEVLIETTLK